MSVGGKIIEIGPHVLRDADNPAYRRDVIRLWVIDRHGTESVVYAEPATELPRVGEEVWWSSGKIWFANDHCHLKKVGYSTDPTRTSHD